MAESRKVRVWGKALPVDLLLVKEDVGTVSGNQVNPVKQLEARQRGIDWIQKRDQMISLGAASLHLAGVAISITANGFEWLPPDRYFGSNPAIRINNGVDAGRFQGVETYIRWKYMAKIEGVD